MYQHCDICAFPAVIKVSACCQKPPAYQASDLSHCLPRSDWQGRLLVGYFHQTHV